MKYANKVMKSNAPVFFASAVAFFTWFAVIFQLYLTEGSIFNFLSYFTILSNLLVAVSLTFNIFLPNTKIGTFFSGISVQTSITLYIFIVALVYNFILRGIWIVTGWQLVVDNMLHVLNPILYIFYWLLMTSKRKLKWIDSLYWMIFPTVYLIYSLIRGSLLNWYPYPFLSAYELGYSIVFINVFAMIVVFFLAALLLIFVNNKIVEKLSNTN